MISPEDTRIAFFGGGAQIAALEAIVQLKQAGYHVVAGVHNPKEAVVLHAADIPMARTPEEALETCDIIITAQATAADLEDLMLGDDGLLEAVQPGTYFIDFSFIPAQLAREIQAMAAINDCDAIDAPIVNLGDKEGPVAFIGGEEETIQTLSPLFPYLAANVFPQSAPGEGQTAAMVACIAFAGSLMGVVEALSLAHISDYSEQGAINAIASTSGGSRALVEYAPHILNREYNGRIKVSEFLDILGVALDSAEHLDVTAPVVETAYQLFELLSVVGGEDLNVQALALLYEEESVCAEYGLDWERAEEQSEYRSFQDFVDDYLEDDYPYDDDEDDERGPHGGPGSYPPPIGGFFSKN
ncbi:MAG: NAD(P)-binding domain-containing protein [Coriobacteriaceae bacterium]|nr:NAD(P)-binding domain-containing protein [Coriobacteriaceae bacterium]